MAYTRNLYLAFSMMAITKKPVQIYMKIGHRRTEKLCANSFYMLIIINMATVMLQRSSIKQSNPALVKTIYI
jgi:hypothetical protein